MNPVGRRREPFSSARTDRLAQTVAARDLTGIFAIYNVAGALGGAFGALASGLPTMLAPRFGWNLLAAQRSGFIAYAILGLIAASIYWSLSPAVEAAPTPVKLGAAGEIARHRDAPGGAVQPRFVRRRLRDSVAARAMAVSPLQPVASRPPAHSSSSPGLLGSFSQFVSSRFAARIGRINTMVYTHIPANAFLILAALMPTAPLR